MSTKKTETGTQNRFVTLGESESRVIWRAISGAKAGFMSVREQSGIQMSIELVID